ncbi:uncharacterized protein ZBIST_4024 [Zygosaccharomyces bailii]|nr:uncharacterized protein ZBIST_4024 [Zygosaccharomyces bailii]
MQALNALMVLEFACGPSTRLGGQMKMRQVLSRTRRTCCQTTVPCHAMSASLSPRRRFSIGWLVCCDAGIEHSRFSMPGTECSLVYILRCPSPLFQLAAELAADKTAGEAAARGVESAPRMSVERVSGQILPTTMLFPKANARSSKDTCREQVSWQPISSLTSAASLHKYAWLETVW